MKRRGSGILLHITSLPSRFGIGDLGPGAFWFADFLADAGQSYWQILPLNRTCTEYGNSPYSSYSAFAGNPVLISPEQMVEDGFLSRHDISSIPAFGKEKVSYPRATRYKEKLLSLAYDRHMSGLEGDPGFQGFCNDHSSWLEDYAFFIALKKRFHGALWSGWQKDVRDREFRALERWAEKLRNVMLKEKFCQYVFFRQWAALKGYCAGKNIQIIGDVPIYVNYDSADVWSNAEVFALDRDKKPEFVAGVPPDYFSVTGQLWGHPVYDWKYLKKTGYSWWIERVEHTLKLFHLFRLDHFRGFVGYWRVREGEKTAVKGEWVKAPAEDFFNVLSGKFTHLPIIAEDLGVITPDVREVINRFGFPGMKVLMFAFDRNLPANPYAPHNHNRNCVVYTGTHDNNTIKGWFRKETGQEVRKRLSEYLGHRASAGSVNWDLIRLAMSSVADKVVIPMQDILGLGEKSRMNLPASSLGNWTWRLVPEKVTARLIKKVSDVTELYGRA